MRKSSNVFLCLSGDSRAEGSFVGAGNELKNGSQGNICVPVTLARRGQRGTGGIHTDYVIDFSGTRRFNDLTAIPGERVAVGGVLTKLRLLLADNDEFSPSVLVPQGPDRFAVRGAVRVGASPESVGGAELHSGVTVEVTLAITFELAAVAPEDAISFGFNDQDVIAVSYI